MKIKVNQGSLNEAFCCSVKKAKETFKDTEVYLDFSYLGKYFRAYAKESHYNYVQKNVKGKVLCSFNTSSHKRDPILSF